MRKIIQEGTETPNMQKWSNVPLTKENVVDYYSQLKFNISQNKTLGYYKTYIDIYENEEKINHFRFDSDELEGLEKLLIHEVLEEMEINEYFDLPQFKKLTEDLIQYGEVANEKISFIPVGLGDVKIFRFENSTHGNLVNLSSKLQEELIVNKLIEKGIPRSDAELIRETSLAKRIVNEELKAGDLEVIEYLISEQQFDEEILTKEQFVEMNDIRLKKYFPDIKVEIAKHKKEISKCQTRDDVESYMRENGLEIKNVHELIEDGFPELNKNFMRNEDEEILTSWDYSGYSIIESEIDECPVFIDPQMLNVSTSINGCMENFDMINRFNLLQNIKTFYWANSDDIKFENYEKVFLTPLLKQYYGKEIAAEHSHFIATESTELHEYQHANNLIEEIKSKLSNIPELGDFLITPTINANGNNYLNFDSAVTNFEFEFSNNINSNYLSLQILNVIYDKADLLTITQDKVLSLISDINEEFRQQVEAELKVLERIAKEHSGASGFQFDNVDTVLELHSNMKTGETGIIKYLGSILNEYENVNSSSLDEIDIFNLLEISIDYANEKNIIANDIPNFKNALVKVIEPHVFEVMKYEEYFQTTESYFEISSISSELKKVINDATIEIIRDFYEKFVDEKELGKIIYYDDDSVNIWSDYKFLDKDNTVCFRNINWFKPQIDLLLLENYLEAFKEDGFDVEENEKLLKVVKAGDYPSYWSKTGVKEQAYNDFVTIMPRKNPINFKIISEEENTLLNKIVEASNLLYEYYNNGLQNAISFPSYSHWELFYSEYVDEYGEVEQEEVMSFDEYYDQELEVNNGYECEALYKVLNIIDDKRLLSDSEELYGSNIASILENNLTSAIEKAQSLITTLYSDFTCTEININKKFLEVVEQNNIELNEKNLTTIEKFDSICALGLSKKSEICKEFLESIETNETLKTGLNILINNNLSNLGENTLMFLTVSNNFIEVNENYKLQNYRTRKYFESYPNINSDELKLELMKIEDIDKSIRLNMGLGSGHHQLIELANMKSYDDVTIDNICFMDKTTLVVAKDIIKMKCLSTDVEAACRLEAANKQTVEQLEID